VHLILRPGYAPWRLQDVIKDVRVHQVSLDDADAVRDVVHEARPDWVFHLAAYGAYSNQTDMSQMVATNLLGWVALLDACVEAGVGAVVNAGSSSEYGFKKTPPTEDTLVEPNSHYAVTKAAATHYGQLTARTRNVRVTTLRLYSAYGPFEEPARLIPTLVRHALRGTLPPLVAPDTARDFVYVDDVCDAMLAAAASAGPSGAVYNVSTGVQTRLRDVVELVRQKLRVTAEPEWGTMPARSWDTDAWTGSNALIAREIGWKPATSLSAGLDRTIEWMRGQR
jgi:nucleoside-diphosphate-sugar epimerase